MAIYPLDGNVRPVDSLLTGVVQGYANDADNFIQDKILPTLFDGTKVEGGKESFFTGTIQRFAANAMFGDPTRNLRIARGQKFPSARGADFDPLVFTCEKYGDTVEVFWEDNKKLVTGGMFDNATAQLAHVTANLMIERERNYAALFGTAATWGGLATANCQQGVPAAPAANQFLGWLQPASDPVAVIQGACTTVAAVGKRANTVVLPPLVADTLRVHPTMIGFDSVNIDRTILSDDRLAQVLGSRFGLKNVHFASAYANTAVGPGVAPVLAPIHGNYMWIGYLPDASTDPSMLATPISNEKRLNVVSQMACGRVISDSWAVEPVEDPLRDCMIYKVRFCEWIGVVGQLAGVMLSTPVI